MRVVQDTGMRLSNLNILSLLVIADNFHFPDLGATFEVIFHAWY